MFKQMVIKMNLIKLIFILLASSGILFGFTLEKNAWADGPVQSGVGSNIKPTAYVPIYMAEPPALTEEQKATMEQMVDTFNLPGPPVPEVEKPWAATTEELSGTETGPGLSQVPGTLVVRKNTNLSSIVPAGYKSTVLEPSVSNDGKYVFYTANWFAGRSINGGTAWTYVNPYADMTDFCCDQDTIYDPARKLMVWYRQGISDINGNNRVRIGVSANGGATFLNYDLTPSGNFGWTNQWFDYPHISVSNNNLWIATNVFNAAGFWTRTVIIRMSLDDMAAGNAVTPFYYAVTDRFNFTPVQGARDTMYWGTHNTTSSMRVYRWSDSSLTIFWDDITIPAWTATTRGSAICTTTDGYNPCARFDDRIVSGWVANWDGYPGERVIGFFWNVKQDGVTFLKPYTNAAVFKERDRAYVSRPFIWNSTIAWIYAAGAPNARGNIGVSVTGVSDYPHHAVLIDDDYNVAPPGWEGIFYVNTSNRGPSNNRWGDYLRVRPHSPAGLDWIATGYVLRGGTTGDFVQPRYVVFGRERDNASYDRWKLK